MKDKRTQPAQTPRDCGPGERYANPWFGPRQRSGGAFRAIGLLLRALCASVVLFSAGCPLAAQVVEVPTVAPDGQSPLRPASFPESPADVFRSPGQTEPPAQISPPVKAESPSEARPGMFQKAIFDATWLGRMGSSGMGMYDLELKTVLALPAPTPDSPLLITPGFAVHYMDGPDDVEMPPRLYDAYCQFRWLHRFSPELGVDLAVAPGVFSDFEQSSSEAFRMTGHGAAAWTWSETTKVVFGAGYFNRLDVKVLPIGGLIWTPSEDVSFEMLFPQPRLAWRIYWTGQYTWEIQDWVYFAAEFGGGTWAIAREGSEPDLVDITDYRLIAGFERKRFRALATRFEIGYVFGRKITYRNGDPEFDPSNTVMVRAGLRY